MAAPLRFPDDLVALQAAWQRTYAELAQVPVGSGTALLRRRLIALSGRLCAHPHWAAPAGWRYGGVELRRVAREASDDSVRANNPASPCPSGPTRAMVCSERADSTDSAKGMERCI
ncbi:hypothetical protein ACFWFZ_17745 [Streptomyces sp. NPDC060232]|uniref:hypothetical protein n=1 Tax=Streptomyces sp. NPDC060232 TaxID=3347079 RepID=UPI0036499A7D